MDAGLWTAQLLLSSYNHYAFTFTMDMMFQGRSARGNLIVNRYYVHKCCLSKEHCVNWTGNLQLSRHSEAFTMCAVATSATQPLMVQASDQVGLGTEAWRTHTPWGPQRIPAVTRELSRRLSQALLHV